MECESISQILYYGINGPIQMYLYLHHLLLQEVVLIYLQIPYLEVQCLTQFQLLQSDLMEQLEQLFGLIPFQAEQNQYE